MDRYENNHSVPLTFAGYAESDGTETGLSGLVNLKNLRAILPYGIAARPCTGDQAVAISVEDFGYLLLGQVQSLEGLKEGEIRITAGSGAEIRLCSGGEILLNGLKITKDGKIQEKV